MQPQLARKYDGLRRDAHFWWASPKLNGIRGFWTAETGLTGRKGLRYTGFEAIEAELKAASETNGFTLIDGELYCAGLTFEEISSAVLSAESVNKDKIGFHVFAVQSSEPYYATIQMIEKLDSAFAGFSRLAPVPYTKVANNRPAVTAICEAYSDQGFEGVCLRHPAYSYSSGRSNYLMKYKLFNETDLTITGVEKSKGGEYAAALVMEGVVDGERVCVSVGVGMNRFQREQYWLGRETMKGLTAEVQYQELTAPLDNGVKSLRCPIFLKLKLDR